MTKSIVEIAKECGEKIALFIAELSDRTSPDDQPEMMLVTSEEIIDLVTEQFTEFADALRKQELDGQEAVSIKVSGNVWRGVDPSTLPDGTKLFTRPQITSERELALLAEFEKLTMTANRYVARRHSIYQNRMRLQIEGVRITEAEFNIEYDAACEKEIK